MAETTYITWNMPNWVTILLMVVIGGGVFAVVSKILADKGAA